jgi:hypothetical protein
MLLNTEYCNTPLSEITTYQRNRLEKASDITQVWTLSAIFSGRRTLEILNPRACWLLRIPLHRRVNTHLSNRSPKLCKFLAISFESGRLRA